MRIEIFGGICRGNPVYGHYHLLSAPNRERLKGADHCSWHCVRIWHMVADQNSCSQNGHKGK